MYHHDFPTGLGLWYLMPLSTIFQPFCGQGRQEIFRAQGQKETRPSSNSPNNDTQTKSTTVCHKQGISTTTRGSQEPVCPAVVVILEFRST